MKIEDMSEEEILKLQAMLGSGDKEMQNLGAAIANELLFVEGLAIDRAWRGTPTYYSYMLGWHHGKILKNKHGTNNSD